MDSGDDYLVSAALLSRGQDSLTLAADLAERFERCLPNRVQGDWVGWGKRRKLKSLVINLEPNRFRRDVDRRGPTAWCDQIVRGIRLRSDQLDFDTWLNRLADTLNIEAILITRRVGSGRVGSGRVGSGAEAYAPPHPGRRRCTGARSLPILASSSTWPKAWSRGAGWIDMGAALLE